MIEPLVSLAFFALPASAPDWRGLAWRTALGAAITLALFLWVTGGRLSLTVPGGDADIGAGIVLYFALTTFVSGVAARALSLMARRFGHPRPWSLWIEALFFFGSGPLLLSA